MSELIVVPESKVSIEKQSGVRITNASDTSKAALKYADELQKEFAELLYKPMAQADVKIAGRFHSLISELRFMVSMTAKNVENGR